MEIASFSQIFLLLAADNLEQLNLEDQRRVGTNVGSRTTLAVS